MNNSDIVQEFREKFVSEQKNINGGLAYLEWQHCEPEEVESFLLEKLADKDKEIARATKLLELARCPDTDCDNNGTIAVRVSDDEWEPQQCQWCDEKRQLLAARAKNLPALKDS